MFADKVACDWHAIKMQKFQLIYKCVSVRCPHVTNIWWESLFLSALYVFKPVWVCIKIIIIFPQTHKSTFMEISFDFRLLFFCRKLRKSVNNFSVWIFFKLVQMTYIPIHSLSLKKTNNSWAIIFVFNIKISPYCLQLTHLTN